MAHRSPPTPNLIHSFPACGTQLRKRPLPCRRTLFPYLWRLCSSVIRVCHLPPFCLHLFFSVLWIHFLLFFSFMLLGDHVFLEWVFPQSHDGLLPAALPFFDIFLFFFLFANGIKFFTPRLFRWSPLFHIFFRIPSWFFFFSFCWWIFSCFKFSPPQMVFSPLFPCPPTFKNVVWGLCSSTFFS